MLRRLPRYARGRTPARQQEFCAALLANARHSAVATAPQRRITGRNSKKPQLPISELYAKQEETTEVCAISCIQHLAVCKPR